MSISLSDGITSVDLPEDLYWSDEDWAPVEQTVERSITGALIIFQGTRVAGRPITLGPVDDSCAWTPRPVLVQVRTWAATPGQQLTLTLRGTACTVVLRHQDGAIEAKPVMHYADVSDADSYLATYRFLTV